jgi:hypothetical protein
MKNIINLLTILSVIVVSPTFASELDSFQKRDQPIENSLPVINSLTDQFLDEAIYEANNPQWDLRDFHEFLNSIGNAPCNEKKLYSVMRKYFRNHVQGKLTPEIINSPEIEKIETFIKNSIYQDFKWHESIMLGGVSKLFGDLAGHMVSVNGLLVGTDKFEHFLGTGFSYFNGLYLTKKNTVMDTLQKGFRLERGHLGARTTGVFSYADLTANFNGMRFWNHVLQYRDDVLGSEFNQGPYITCQNDQWVKVKSIDWSNYIDLAWDEAYNCSKFKTKGLVKKVKARLHEFSERENKDLSCPLQLEEIEELTKKYKGLSPYLINSTGHDVIN